MKPLVRAVDLNVGETRTVELADGSVSTVKLLDLREERDTLRGVVRRAVVTVEINSVRRELVAANYRLPESAGGVQVDCAVTRGYTLNGINNVWNLKSDARIRLWPADSPWIRPGTFLYPAKQRWFASDTQMANDPCYAFLWESYHALRKTPLQAVARPHHFVWTSQPVTLDGTRSWSAAGRDGIQSFQWRPHDGATGNAATHTLRYEQSGTYSEVLKVTGRSGRIDYEVAVVQVIDKDHPLQLPPSIHATYAPTEHIAAGDEITFKVRAFRIGATEGHEIWSFGDGSREVTVQSDGNARQHDPDGYAVTTHRYQKPGHYLVAVRRMNERGQSATAHLHVQVGIKNESDSSKKLE